jgi:TrmH family RNA methyltransferase
MTEKNVNFVPINRFRIMKISKAKVSFIASLKMKKHRDANAMFVAEGEKCVGDLLPYFKPVTIVLKEGFVANDNVMKVLDNHRDITFEATAKELDKMTSFSTSSPILAVFEKPNYEVDESLITTDLSLVLDGIQDPGNLGTIVRLADWYGVTQIFCSKETADVYNSKAVQSTMGALSRVKLFYCDLEQLIEQHEDISVCGLLLDGKNIYRSELPKAAFVVMGNEGNGISQVIRRKVTSSLLIPSYPQGVATSESLNVAMATAITLSEFRRRLC